MKNLNDQEYRELCALWGVAPSAMPPASPQNAPALRAERVPPTTLRVRLRVHLLGRGGYEILTTHHKTISTLTAEIEARKLARVKGHHENDISLFDIVKVEG